MSDQQSEGLARSGNMAMPSVTPQQMVQALNQYRELQRALDEAMPDQIMDLDGRKFRKKGYWRALGLAFNLEVEVASERREVSGKFIDGRENFGWVVTYYAKHPNGRRQTGDGSCFAVEKSRRFKCPHPENENNPSSKRTKHFPHNTCPDFDPDFQWRSMSGDATEHNVRSHAHTRAYNRAVSNLVGFGEVSAEEVEHGEPTSVGSGQTAAAAAASTTGQTRETVSGQNAEENPTTYVKSVSIRNGVTKKAGKPDKPWQRFDVLFEDGRTGNTFRKGDGEHAQNAQKTHALVRPRIEQNGDFFNLTEFLPLEQHKPEAPHQPDEPVNGPEDVLVVRDVKSDDPTRKRWIIQTSKRQLVTDVPAYADACVQARTLKVGIVPEFELVDSTDGTKKISKLTKLTIEDTIIAAGTAEPAATGDAPAETSAEEQQQDAPGQDAKAEDKPRRRRANQSAASA